MPRPFRASTPPGLLVLAVACAATLLPETVAHAQRRIQGQRYGGGPLYQNPAGRALGSGAVNIPDGILGQNAMGAGDALDSNLQVGSGGRNFRRSSGYSYEAIQARNLVVTNGVTGGRGFRGTVDYYAPGDFAAPTGDRDAYEFRRDSALSGLDFVSSRQRQDAFNIAQGVGVFQYRRDFTSLPEVNTVTGASRIDDAQIRLDRATNNLSSRNLLTTAVAPSDIGLVQVAENEYVRMTASPIRGIQFESPSESLPLATYDLALANEAMVRGEDLTFAGVMPEPFDATRSLAGDPDSDAIDERITSPATGESRYTEIIERVYQEYEGRDDVKLTTDGLERMRRDFERIGRPRIGSAEDTRAETSNVQRDGLPGERREGLPGDRHEGLPGERTTTSGLGLGPADGEPAEDGAVLPPDPSGAGAATEEPGTDEDDSTVRTTEELIDALAHRTQVNELVDPRMRARVAELVGQAEQSMRDKDYFRAEDRFDQALKLNPGNPMLEGGRANAQIGAGLYRSASVTLSGLFRRHEGMIDVGYDSDLLPSRTRLRLAAQSIEVIVAKDPRGSSEMGLVVAYIGRQLGDRSMIVRGLESIDSPRLTPLIPSLRRIWTSGKPIPGIGDDTSE
jgi:hypothetical protein